MNELPQGWEWSTIGEICEVNPRMSKASLEDTDQVTFVPMAAVATESGQIDLSDVRDAGPLKSKSFRQFAEGDVLVAKITPSMENGKGAVASGLAGGRGFGSTEFHVLRSSVVSAQFLLRFLLQPGFRADAARSMTGTAGQMRVPADYLRRHPIPVPPTAEQRRIVAAIDEHFSRLDAAEAALARVDARLSKFDGHLVAWILGVTDAPSIHDESPTEALPDGWEWRRAGDVCDGVVSGSTPKASKMTQNQGEVPFLKVYNVRFDGSLDFNVKPTFVSKETHISKLKRSRVFPGDVLTNIVGPPLGKMSVVPSLHPEWNINQAIAAFKPSAEMNSTFLSYLLLTDVVMRPLLRTGKATAGQINLSITACRQLWLPVPQPDEQLRLIPVIEQALAACQQTEGQLEVALARSRNLRQAVLAAAFSGQLVAQDPADEPASVLLKRIAAQGAVAKPLSKRKASK